MVELVSIHSFLIKRMMAVAEEIFDTVKDNIIVYQTEIERLKEENRSLKSTLNYTRNCNRAKTSNDNQSIGADGLLQRTLGSEISDINVQMEVTTGFSHEPVSQASEDRKKELEPIECFTQQAEIMVENEDFGDLNMERSVPIKREFSNDQVSQLSSPEVENGNMRDGHVTKTRKARQTSQMACNICGKSFHSKKCLRIHQVVHQNERPFSCDSCRWRFKLKSHLNEHKRLHTGDYRYKCPKCGKGFSRSNLVKLHLKSYHSS
ncbi:gastrula zinc finger protein XlCGF48.2 [Triplophysa rosa]|uniref:C2H2-type domain-containing protein n=1 Tax=Triplophysa rosa TaxID=992332 RepID=A0A9W7TGA7_TRIRA|nr:gastrula zinc finger protein XlCGF48.2 [Triplophysa rosa]KAI7795547.1 hypothetical protein IRJ41_021816 [Triplophysa rosa]